MTIDDYWSLCDMKSKGKVDLRSCWFLRRCPPGPLPYVHSPHLFRQFFNKLANSWPLTISGPEGCFPLRQKVMYQVFCICQIGATGQTIAN